MNQSKQSKQVLLSVIGVAILVVAVVGVSFAFFNYTRTGGANTIKTGQINFITTDPGTSLTNLFPVSSSAITDSTTSNVASQVLVASVRIQGDTTYANGLDYTVYADAVDLQTTGAGANITLPISIDVFAQSALGTVTDKAASAAASDSIATTITADTVYTYDYDGSTAANTITTGSVLARGHIAPGAQGVDGYIYVRAYIDDTNILITDTVGDGENESNNGNVNVEGYINGTSLGGKTQITTAQWNSLGSSGNGASFKLKVIATEAATRT